MTTCVDIITRAFGALGVYGTNDALTDADAQTARAILNDMLDSWSNESLTLFATQLISFPLVPGQQSYTIGTGGQVNTTRPLRLFDTPGAAYIQDGNGNNFPVRIVTFDQWGLIGNRSAAVVTSNFPDTLFYDPQFPLGVLNFNPTPSAPYTVFLNAYLQLTDFANLAQNVVLPPGYAKMLWSNLAIDLKPFFADGKISEEIVKAASDSKAAVKRTNTRKLVSRFDGAIVSRAGGSYNIYTDGSGNAGSVPT